MTPREALYLRGRALLADCADAAKRGRPTEAAALSYRGLAALALAGSNGSPRFARLVARRYLTEARNCK